MLVTRTEAAPLLGYADGESLGLTMRRRPDRWPAPVACRIRRHTLLWDLAELKAADYRPGPVGPGTTVSDSDGMIPCLECGRRFRGLARHLDTHQLSAAQYRARHSLPPDAALAADRTRAGIRAQCRKPTPAPALDSGGPLDLGAPLDWVEGIEATAALKVSDAARLLGCGYSTVRNWRIKLGLHTPRPPAAARPPRTTPKATIAAAHATRENLARAAGHPDWATAIEATVTLELRDAAHQLGCGYATIRRWRIRLGHPTRPAPAPKKTNPPENAAAARAQATAQARDNRARAAGYPDWVTAIEATRTLPREEAAAQIGCHLTTISKWRTKLEHGDPAALAARKAATLAARAAGTARVAAERREEMARAAGHPDWATAIAATGSLTAAAAAEHLACSAYLITTWRTRLAPPGTPPAAPRQQRVPRPSGADQAAFAAGYPDRAAAIAATRTLPTAEVARQLGCAPETIARWRTKLDHEQGLPTGRREQRARAAGYDDWATAIAATRTLDAAEAAHQLRSAPETIARWRTRLGHEQPPHRLTWLDVSGARTTR